MPSNLKSLFSFIFNIYLRQIHDSAFSALTNGNFLELDGVVIQIRIMLQGLRSSVVEIHLYRDYSDDDSDVATLLAKYASTLEVVHLNHACFRRASVKFPLIHTLRTKNGHIENRGVWFNASRTCVICP
ncbi:hypothetical protein AcW1_009801 [Taiwanofungus camphoratus]|nr:hypothetical protein AcV5_002301 [Antrodia cinnamomea]KAI0941828.1 hypothetical protein AcV7_002407 [Antrodia cinnamomea]KAI0948231.1 hypothetical protein AcW1_009801 [Antrodia cinnamomea]